MLQYYPNFRNEFVRFQVSEDVYFLSSSDHFDTRFKDYLVSIWIYNNLHKKTLEQ